MGTLDLLEKRWPGVIGIPLGEMASALSMSRQTAYNQHSSGVFPVKVVRMGRKPIVLLADLAAFLDGQRGISAEFVPPQQREKRGPGRPKKYPTAHGPNPRKTGVEGKK